jgi:PleD family two-component response regulator
LTYLRHPQRQAFAQMFGLQTVSDASALTSAILNPEAAVSRADVTCHVTGGPLRRVYQELSISALRRGEPLSLVLFQFELDPSSRRGHTRSATEKLLAEIGRILISTFRGSDVVVRWGEDQIAALLPRTDASNAARAAEKALVSLSRSGVLRLDADSTSHPVTAGVAVVVPGAPFSHTMDEALRNAQLARRAGGGRVQWQGGELIALGTRVAVVDPADLFGEGASLLAELGGEPMCLPSLDACIACATTGLALLVLVLDSDPENGLRELMRARKHRLLRDRPVLVVGESKHLPRAFDVGADDFVVRPIDPAELGARAQRLLGRRRPAPPSQP